MSMRYQGYQKDEWFTVYTSKMKTIHPITTIKKEMIQKGLPLKKTVRDKYESYKNAECSETTRLRNQAVYE